VSTALVVFEDSNWRDLRPLTDALPVPALAFGAGTLLQRWRRAAKLPLFGVTARPDVFAAWDAPEPDPQAESCEHIISVNAAFLPGPWFDKVLQARTPARYVASDVLVAVRMPAQMLRGKSSDGTAELPEIQVDAKRLRFPWDFISGNARAIEEDLTFLAPAREGEINPRATLLVPERVAVRSGAIVDPYAILDAREGAILIDEGAKIQAHTVVIGPCVVGERTELLGGVVGRTTFGPECRIAGEVDECVWQGYANKRHHGFVGHSVIGEWVNLGALTTTSDLKNNYGNVRVTMDGTEKETGSNKIGSFLGAHVKTGIGTLLPTGAYVGVGSNLFGGGKFAPKFVPPFSWWDGDKLEEHRIDAFIATARLAMDRRRKALTTAQENQLKALFSSTAAERRTDPLATTAHPFRRS
jgi:UDP-N-acetylglucosamine diphosphorylase / glucose-1-phosphate thymidylyltransferase / UDP-N-acetylgalactosamine diphosphorylase / glucosamine-1-phosphate N-acetyltransferase / galactosamine-1-phosphate N-acetyltransferase